MSNSNIIGDSKRKIVKEFIKDKEIIEAINSYDKEVKESPEKLIGTHIFDYHQDPYTIDKVITFITIQVHTNLPYSMSNDLNKTFIEPTIEIWIISHQEHMIVDNIPKITENRNDYLSMLIDKKLNGSDNFGIGKLTLTTNIEGSFQRNYLFRKMIFSCKSLNDSLCDNGI